MPPVLACLENGHISAILILVPEDLKPQMKGLTPLGKYLNSHNMYRLEGDKDLIEEALTLLKENKEIGIKAGNRFLSGEAKDEFLKSSKIHLSSFFAES